MLRTSLVLFLAALTMGPIWGCGSNRDSGGDQTAGQTTEQVIASAGFVGSTKCLSCHGDKQNWGHTLHKLVLRAPLAFSTPQEKGEALYPADNMNRGLRLSLGTTHPEGADDLTSPDDGEAVAYYHDGSSWKSHYQLGLGATVVAGLPATSGAFELKYTAQIVAVPATSNNFFVRLTNALAVESIDYPILFTYGGESNYKQRDVLTLPGRGGKHISPLQYNDMWATTPTSGVALNNKWVPYHAERWYDPATDTLAQPTANHAFDGNCAGCHFTGYTLAKNANDEELADAVDDPNGAIDFDGDGTMDEINIGCEACHGAGSVHASTLNPAYIVNPANLSRAESDMVCGQCHIRGKSVDSFTDHFSEATVSTPAKAPFPARQAADGTVMKFRPGLDNLADYYSFDSGTGSFDGQYWGNEPSGGDFVASSSHHQQYIDILQGPHNPDKIYDARCFDCHDSHNNRAFDGKQIVSTIVEDGVEVKTSTGDNSLCLTCHAGHGPFANLTPAQIADIFTNGAPAEVQTAVGDHTLNDAYHQHAYDPAGDPGESNCVNCHLPKTAKSALEGDIKSHTFDVIWPSFIQSDSVSRSGFDSRTAFQKWYEDTGTTPPADPTGVPVVNVGMVPNSCITIDGCHAAGDGSIVSDWAASGHADGFGEPFNHWNFDADISASCVKCHSQEGYIQFVNGEPLTAQSKTYPKALSCPSCHEPEAAGATFFEAGKVQQVVFPANEFAPAGQEATYAVKTLNNSSNLCMECHQGRESGLSIANATPNSAIQTAVPDYDSFDFINRHYFAAAAIMFGNEVDAGFEYRAKTEYRGQTPFPAGAHDGINTCTGCHMGDTADHNFATDIADCSGCHDGIADFNDLNLPGGGDVDYDGDTVPESFQSEIDGFAGDGISVPSGLLYVAIQNYASTTLLSPIVYGPGSYPYWFKDNGAGGGIAGNGIPDGGEASFGNRYRDFDIQLLQAAYNFHSAQDPCGDIHNYQYVIQTLYDSMDDLDDDLQNDSATGNRP